MRLSAKAIINYQNINSFKETSEWTIRSGEANTLYFRLVDLDQDSLRYIPAGTTPGIQVTFPSLNTANILVKTATQVSALDGSVWSVSLTDLEKPSSGNVQFALTESGNTKRFILLQGLVVENFNVGGC